MWNFKPRGEDGLPLPTTNTEPPAIGADVAEVEQDEEKDMEIP